MVCSACGHDNRDQARFCEACGVAQDVRPPRPDRPPSGYTPRHLREKILASRSALEGERKRVTVLFADVKGSMELAEQVDPEVWHRVMDRFLRILADGVHRYEGTVNQYTGDGIMALFGAPIAHEDHAQRACHAALELRRELRRYADEVRVTRGLNFSVRMGLNSGDVVVGKIGDDLRMDYTAHGHTVGLAQRMEQIAESGHAYLSERTARLVDGFFELRDLGETQVKGSRAPVRIYALEKPGTLRTRLDVSIARGLSRFVGRRRELGVLESALEDALGGKGRVVGVLADAGTGKSRLCYEFSERCRRRGIAVFEGHCLSHGRQMPMLPMLELLRHFLGVGDGTRAEDARERIALRLLGLDEALASELALVFDLMGVPDPQRPLEAIDPEAHHARILAAIQRIVAANREPAVLLVEDLHWLDAASESLLARVVTAAADAAGLLVVVNFRPEYEASWGAAPHYRELALAPLDRDATAELLAELLGPAPSVARLPALIEARTGGNPFFIEEVVQMLVDTHALFGSRGAWELAHPVEDLAVPETVQSVLAARIDRLDGRAKHVLQAAAVIGRQGTLRLLARASGLPDAELGAVLARLGETEFLHEVAQAPQAEFQFKNPLTEAVAYESQLREQRERIHREVARGIEEFARDGLDEQAARLAYHWEAAGEKLAAAGWHRRAAEWIELSEPTQALRHWRRVRRLTGAVDTPEGARLQALGSFQTLNLGWRLGLPDAEMRSAVAECRDSAARIDDPALIVRAICAYAVCLNFRGEVADNVGPLSEALEIARAEHSVDMEIDVLLTLLDCAHFLGRLSQAEQFSTRVIELAGEDPAHVNFSGTRSYLESLAKRGEIRAELGRHREAREDVDLALDLSEAHAPAENLLIALIASVRSAELSGAVQQSVARSSRLSQLALKSGSPLWTLAASTCAGLAHLSNRRWLEALGFLESVVARIEERGLGRHDLGRALTALARAQLGAGAPNEAALSAARAVRVLRSGGMRAWECRARVALAEARLASEGKPARRKVREGLKRSERLIEQTGARAYVPLLCEMRAALARERGDGSQADEELREARRLYGAMDATGHAERVGRQLTDPP